MTNEIGSLVVGYLVTCFINEHKYNTEEWKYPKNFTEHTVSQSKMTIEPHPTFKSKKEYVIKQIWTLNTELDKEQSDLLKEKIIDEYVIKCNFSYVSIEEFYEIQS